MMKMKMMMRKQIIEISKQGKKFQMVGSEASSWLFTSVVVKDLNLGLSITNAASGQRGAGFNTLTNCPLCVPCTVIIPLPDPLVCLFFHSYLCTLLELFCNFQGESKKKGKDKIIKRVTVISLNFLNINLGVKRQSTIHNS